MYLAKKYEGELTGKFYDENISGNNKSTKNIDKVRML